MKIVVVLAVVLVVGLTWASAVYFWLPLLALLNSHLF